MVRVHTRLTCREIILFCIAATSPPAPHKAVGTGSVHVPIWLDWRIGKRRLRKPMGTSDWHVAQLRARDLEAEGPAANAAPFSLFRKPRTNSLRTPRPAADCVNQRSANTSFSFAGLNEHFKNKGYVFLTHSPGRSTGIPDTWKMSPRTASKHIERMKTFFKFARTSTGSRRIQRSRSLRPR